MSIYKACDIRGRYGIELLPEHALKLGSALAKIIKPKKIIVAGDGRLSTPRLKETLIKSLSQAGFLVYDIGIVSTPVFYFARQHLNINPGVMVTASHNPAPDNGFKIILGEFPIKEQTLEIIEHLVEDVTLTTHCPPGSIVYEEILNEYIASRRGLTPNLKDLKVVIDCAHGMGSVAANQIWNHSEAETLFLNNCVNGHFPLHPPNPAKPKHLRQLAKEVQRIGADFGAAYDGDADRVGFVDEKGHPLPTDKVIAILARNALKKNSPAPIVFDQKCSRLVADMIRKYNGKPIREKSGHTFIKTTFLKQGAPYAGELSGHHFFKQIHGDDGIYASLVMGGILKKAGKPLSRLAAEIPSYPITPDIRIPMIDQKIDQILSDLITGFSGEGTISTVDGVRVELERAWGLVRKSVTEPVLTLRFEGNTEQDLTEIMERFVQVAPELEDKL